MKIWIDGLEANVAQRLGSSQVAFELIRNFEKIDNKNDYTILLPNLPFDDFPQERKGWKYKVLKPKSLWTRIALPLALYSAKQKPDFFFSPSHYIPRFIPKSIKVVSTIFDLSFLHFPQMFTKGDLWKLKNWTKYSVENSDHIITISNFSKADLAKQYPVRKDKITVAYPGYNQEFFKCRASGNKIQEVKRKYKIKDNYLIYIGTIQPRKNLVRLMEAFSKVVKDLEDIELVLIGKTRGEGRQGWMYEDILQTPKKMGIENQVKFLGFVPTEDLPLLLSGALVFVQPSLWEGFGIPIVEAMATGVPVIASNISSLPEIVEKTGLLIDPYSVDQIEQAIRTIVTDKKLREKYSKAGIAQAQKFSWDKMARTVLKVLEESI